MSSIRRRRTSTKAPSSGYEQRQQGLGRRFFDAIETAIDDAAEHPLRHPILEQDVRRRLLRVFPYSVLYVAERDHVLVLALMHNHREPGYWRSRIG